MDLCQHRKPVIQTLPEFTKFALRSQCLLNYIYRRP